MQTLLESEEHIAAEISVSNRIFDFDSVVVGGIGDEYKDILHLLLYVVQIRVHKFNKELGLLVMS